MIFLIKLNEFYLKSFQSDTYSLPPEVNRPSSISSLPLKSEETIALVTEKVRKMDAR